MEVLGNGSHVKDTENETTEMSFSCRLPRDNIGNGAVPRNKGETDVRLLVACKTQLSSEVIRWKTESLRLQKERDAARIRTKELEQRVGKFSERTRELENRLSVAEDENKRLREKLLGLSNISAFQKSSVNLDKFHSYPWSETLPNPSAVSNSCINTLEIKKSPPPQEDWKEVSQQLLEKMKQEMKEIAEFNCSFSLQESCNVQVNEVLGTSDISDDELEKSLSSMKSDAEFLKHQLLQQRKTLKLLINNIIQGKVRLRTEEISKDESQAIKTSQLNMDQSGCFVKRKASINQSSRHSDDSFHAFFTKHLESCQNLDKMNKTMQLFMQSDSQNASDSSRSASKVTSPRSVKSQTETNRRNAEEERVCPICEASFHESVPQYEFEQHVLNHLEVESASLLDQYVVL